MNLIRICLYSQWKVNNLLPHHTSSGNKFDKESQRKWHLLVTCHTSLNLIGSCKENSFEICFGTRFGSHPLTKPVTQINSNLVGQPSVPCWLKSAAPNSIHYTSSSLGSKWHREARAVQIHGCSSLTPPMWCRHLYPQTIAKPSRKPEKTKKT